MICGHLITGADWSTQTCENDQAVTLFRVPDLAASQQQVVQVQRVALPLPVHRPRELVQPVVWFFTLNESCTQASRRMDSDLDGSDQASFSCSNTPTVKRCQLTFVLQLLVRHPESHLKLQVGLPGEKKGRGRSVNMERTSDMASLPQTTVAEQKLRNETQAAV